MALQGPASPGQWASLLGPTAQQYRALQLARGWAGDVPPQLMMSSSCYFPSTPPYPGTPGVGAGMLVWAHEWGEEMVPSSETTGFVSPRPEIKPSL